MKKVIYFCVCIFYPFLFFCQETTTTIDGIGNSCEDARKDALRNDVNKAAGSIIYSKTEVENDKLISDEITMLTSGNILHYDEIKPCSEFNGKTAVTLKVTVSQSELKKFIEGKGKSVSISGELLKQKSDQEFQANKAELGIVEGLLKELDPFVTDPFDYEISIGQVTIREGKYCDLPAEITIKANNNFYNTYVKLAREIEKITISEIDQTFRKTTLKQSIFAVTLNSTTYYLRNQQSCYLIDKFYKNLVAKTDEYTIVDDCLKELFINIHSKESILKGNLIFPPHGSIVKKISGNLSATIEEVGALNRINIFASNKLSKYKNNRKLSGDLTLMQYSETNPLEFQTLSNNINKSLESIARERENGKIRCTYKILFSNEGINRSRLDELKFSDKNFKVEIEKSIAAVKLNPSKLCGGFIKTTDSIKVDYRWETYRSTFVYEKNKRSTYTSYFNQQQLPFGTYVLTVKEKELNSKVYKDVFISNYKTRGPLNALYSVLLPGWGTRRVTYNERSGWGRFWLVAAPMAISFSSRFISRSNYDKYMSETTDQEQMNYYYLKANNWNKSTVFFCGLGVAFYVFDLSWTFNQGVKNLKSKNKIQEKIKDQSLQILSQKVS